MSGLFLAVLDMSITASYAILIVMIVRLLLKKAPKVISYVLWSVVAFRLIIPFSFESIFSLMPRNTNVISIPHDIIYQQDPQANSSTEAEDSFINQPLPVPAVKASANPLQVFMETAAYIWISGIMVLLIYSLVSISQLKRQLKSAHLIEQNIYQAGNLKTPFVLGLINPRIYLPVGLSKEEQNYILIHEQTHIHRKDHIIKTLAFLIMTIHWFNPLVWIAFMLMSADMELSCDEKVLKVMNEDIKKPYANSLLSLAAGRHVLNGSPLAFGEGNVKGRIKNVLNYKKPRFWIIFFSIVIVAAIGIGLVANPMSMASLKGSTYRVNEILHQDLRYSFIFQLLYTTPQYGISYDYKLYSKPYVGDDWTMHGRLYRYKISGQELHELFYMPSDNVREAINKIKMVYRADTGDDNNTFYLVMQLKDGDLLLAIGYDNEKAGHIQSHIRWLFRLEKHGDVNVEDINVEAAGKKLNDKDINNEKDIDNDDQINGGLEQSIKEPLKEKEESEIAKHDALSIRQEVELPDFEYDGNDPIEKLVYATEIEKYSQPQRGFTIVAPKIFASYEEDGLLKVFVTTFSATYKLYGNVLDEMGGSVVPSAITYKKDGSGNYVLEKYEQAKDGADWEPSIRKFCTMPVSGKEIPGLADKIIDHYGNRDDIRTLLWKNLFKHLKANGIKDATLFNSRGEIEFSMSNPQYMN